MRFPSRAFLVTSPQVLQARARGGDILISSPTLTLQDQAAIYADTIGSGQGGNIGMKVSSLSLSGGSRISSSTYDSTGDGGQVTVQADKDMSFTGTIQRSLLGLLRRREGRRHQTQSSRNPPHRRSPDLREQQRNRRCREH